MGYKLFLCMMLKNPNSYSNDDLLKDANKMSSLDFKEQFLTLGDEAAIRKNCKEMKK